MEHARDLARGNPGDTVWLGHDEFGGAIDTSYVTLVGGYICLQ